MGFSTVTIGGSDAASDAHWLLGENYPDNAIETLNREFHKHHSCYNTPGPVNVALCILDGEYDLSGLEGYNALVSKTHEWLGVFIQKMEENPEEESSMIRTIKKLQSRLGAL